MSISEKSVRDVDQQFWSSSKIPHLVIRSTQNSSIAYKAHSHPELSIGIITSGVTNPTINDKQVLLSKDEIILIEPQVVHACNPVQGKTRSYYMLYLNSDWCCDILSSVYEKEIKAFVCDQHVIDNNKDSCGFLEAVTKVMDSTSFDSVLRINNLLFKLVIQYCIPTTEIDSNNELAYLIRSKLVEDIVAPPSVTEIAQELGRPKESIIRIFKRSFGITPKAFLNNHRIEKTKFLLRQGMNIVDVALDVGYSDQSQMHRAFVNYTAATPRQYQKLTSIFDNN